MSMIICQWVCRETRYTTRRLLCSAQWAFIFYRGLLADHTKAIQAVLQALVKKNRRSDTAARGLQKRRCCSSCPSFCAGFQFASLWPCPFASCSAAHKMPGGLFPMRECVFLLRRLSSQSIAAEE